MYKRTEKARDLFLEGYNCSQAVFCAFNDIFGIDDITARKISAGLGGGIGRLRNVCGGVCGGTLVIGLIYGATEGSDQKSKGDTYKVVRDFADKVALKHGSYICTEITGKRKEEGHIPDERTPEYYRKRPCVAIIETCAELVCEILTEAGYEL